MKEQMPVRLSTTVSKIASLPNATNAALMNEFYYYMKNNGASESHTNNSLKTNMTYAKFLGPDVTFYDVKRKEDIVKIDVIKSYSRTQGKDKIENTLTNCSGYKNS